MSDELTAVRTVLADPEGPGDAAWTAARAALLREIERSSAATVRARRPRRWIPTVGLGTAVLIAGVVLLVTQVFVRGGAVQASPAAAAVLRRAADAALASPPVRLKAGEYWYEENIGTYLAVTGARQGTMEAFVPQVERYWIGARSWIRRDVPGRIRPAQPITHPWQRRLLSTFIANPSVSGRGSGFDLPVSYRRMLRAPSSTSALANWVLYAEVAPAFTPKPRDRAQIMFTTIHDILIEPMVPARLQAGLYRVAATIPGVRMLGLRHDTLGRTGLAVGFVDHNSGFEDELLFDPSSYALLDYDTTTRHRSGPLPAGTVTQETAFLAAGLVHRVGQVIRARP